MLHLAQQTPLERLEEFLSVWGHDRANLSDTQLAFEARRLEELWTDARDDLRRGSGIQLQAEALLHHWKAELAYSQGDEPRARAHTGVQISLERKAKAERIRCARLELGRVMRKFNVPEETGRGIATLVWAPTEQHKRVRCPTLRMRDGTCKYGHLNGVLYDWPPSESRRLAPVL